MMAQASQSIPFNQSAALRSPISSGIKNSIKDSISSGWRLTCKIIHHHTDAISSVGILVITTCLLAAKIFPNIPSFIPSGARMVLNVGGIIWLNVQVRDFIKSCRDCARTVIFNEFIPFLETAAKVFVKGVNLLLTAVYFGVSVAALFGGVQVSAAIYLTLRPLSLIALTVGIGNDVWDYFANEALLVKFDQIENDPSASLKLAKLMRGYLSIILPGKKTSQKTAAIPSPEMLLASRVVRQLDMHTLETFSNNIGTKKIEDPRTEAIRLYYSVKDSLISKQAGTKSNMSLMALGYFSMGICRAYPDSLVEMTSRFTMSVLYTDEMIRSKLFQSDLAASLS